MTFYKLEADAVIEATDLTNAFYLLAAHFICLASESEGANCVSPDCIRSGVIEVYDPMKRN